MHSCEISRTPNSDQERSLVGFTLVRERPCPRGGVLRCQLHNRNKRSNSSQDMSNSRLGVDPKIWGLLRTGMRFRTQHTSPSTLDAALPLTLI